jgi:hypothetical protein
MASVAVAGSLAQRPGHGGHAWVVLNYLLGLRRLGHEVTFVDRLDADGAGARWLHEVMADHGLERAYVLVTEDRDSRSDALRRLRGTDLLIDVNGYLDDEELRAACAVTAFLDIDPAIQQMWQALGQASIFGRHDLYFTVGESIGGDECLVPTCGVDWIPTRQPVVIDEWSGANRGNGFTSLATWRGPYAPVEFDGRTFGMRVHEFRRFFELPQRVDGSFRLALDIEPAESRDLEALQGSGWDLIAPDAVAATPARYREFIHGSLAELAIPKEIYVAARCGWFSDRSACYLASGKPVITVDTGFSSRLPTGQGLLAVDDVETAAEACEAVLSDPSTHERAAAEIARQHFDSDLVLGRILDAAGI